MQFETFIIHNGYPKPPINHGSVENGMSLIVVSCSFLSFRVISITSMVGEWIDL